MRFQWQVIRTKTKSATYILKALKMLKCQIDREINVLLTSDDRCTYSSSLTPSFINETSPKTKMLNLSKISCQDVIYSKNVDLLSTTTVLQILPRVLPPLLLLLLLFEVGEFPLRSLSRHKGLFPKNTINLNLFYCRQLSFCITSSAEEITFSYFSSSRKCSEAQFL